MEPLPSEKPNRQVFDLPLSRDKPTLAKGLSFNFQLRLKTEWKKQLKCVVVFEVQIPGMLDWLGWCTWDAFYSDVNPQGIKDGLMSLSQGGTPARFLLIDDGWQDTINEFLEQGEQFVDGLQ